jgi:hypothetical protein
MMVLLILATIVDLGLAALLVGISGFIFEGPEGMRGDPAAVAMWVAALAACLAAPVVGFILRGRGRAGLGLVVACLPPLGGVVLASGALDAIFLR